MFSEDNAMISLEQLPSIVLHQIISYLPYEALLALRDSSHFFTERVEDQVIARLSLSLPLQDSKLSVISRVRSRPVLDLSVTFTLRDCDTYNFQDGLKTLQTQLDDFNLTKVGTLAVKIEPETNDQLSGDFDLVHSRLEYLLN